MIVNILILAGIVLILMWLLFKRPKPLYHRSVDKLELKRFIAGLMEIGADGTILLIEHQGSDRFIQFAKYIESEDMKNLHFGFPDAPWSENFFENIRKAFDEQGVKYYIRNVAEDKDVIGAKRFLEIDYIPDVDMAFKIAITALSNMALQETAKFTVHYEGYVDHRENKKYIQKQRAIGKHSR